MQGAQLGKSANMHLTDKDLRDGTLPTSFDEVHSRSSVSGQIAFLKGDTDLVQQGLGGGAVATGAGGVYENGLHGRSKNKGGPTIAGPPFDLIVWCRMRLGAISIPCRE
jgi:hypothetical protein